jgi:hypothetical protein
MCQGILVGVVLKRHGPLESDDAMKVARHVREGAVGKGPSSGYHLEDQAGRSSIGTSLAAYFISNAQGIA